MAVPEQCVLEGLAHLEQLCKQDVALTAYLEVTQDQVDRFAAVSFDRQWIHTDVQRSKEESPFKGTISHGLLNLSMAAHFLMSSVKMCNVRYGLITALNYVRFPAPVPVGSRIRGRVRLVGCERLRDSNQAVWMITVERKGGMIPVCVAEFVVRYYE